MRRNFILSIKKYFPLGIANNEDLRVRRAVNGFQFRTINSAPCSMPGTFLNEKRKNGRWYWYCYYNDEGNLAWMAMRCPNKRLFDPIIQKCVVNLTSTTEATSTSSAATTLSTVTKVTLTKVESTTGITTSSSSSSLSSLSSSSTTTASSGPTVATVTQSVTTVNTP